KALSSSTLSLRFMQNAEQKHTTQQAQIRDDSEWELPQKATSVSEDTVTYEHSYLPFLFHQTRGRRTFDKHGKEVTQVSASAEQPGPTITDPSITAGAKKQPRPKSISSFGLSTIDPKKEKDRDPSKSAKHAIRDISGVGTDLRTRPPPSSSGFMKPQGIDLPAVRSVKKEEVGERTPKTKK
ncbi:hypothetical protein J3A83DRAFT_4056140, partial [Scleroderma citrinum]